MPDPILTLDHDQVKVAPGSQASIKITVRSTSSRVEGFRLGVIGGTPSRWSEVNPSEVDVYPGEEATATVVFSPPTGSQTLSGTFPFGVRAQSTESSDDSAVVEGDVAVGEVDGLQAKLVPVTSSGRLRGGHVLQLKNQGNVDVELHLSATDPDDLVRVQLNPQRVDLGVDEEQTVRVTVRPKRPILLGAHVRLPFELTGEPVVAPTASVTGPYGAPGQLRLDGAMTQRPVFNRAALILVGILVLLLVAGGVWIRTHPPDITVPLREITAEAPPAPAGIRARAVSTNKIRLEWQPLQQITSYEIVNANGTDPWVVQRVSWNQTSQVVSTIGSINGPQNLRPNHRYCLRIRGMRYDTRGAISGMACATTEAPTPSPSPTPTPTPTPTTPVRFWLVAYRFPKAPAPKAPGVVTSSASPSPAPTAAATPNLTVESRKSLRQATAALNRLAAYPFVNAQIVDSELLPKMTVMDQKGTGDTVYRPLEAPAWVVAVGQYPAPDGTLATDCLRLKEYLRSTAPCVVAQAPGA